MEPAETESAYEVTVIGDDPRAVESVPGSAHVVTEEDLARRAPLSVAEALAGVPGLSVQEEDPIGLRLNIGIRGLNPNRSRKVLVLEDGMPISLAPYGEPEMYYTPPIERMDRVEIVKGSGSILFGPQTIGGVVNYVTASPPEELHSEVQLRAGTWGYWQGHAELGDTVGSTGGSTGYLVSLLHQRFEGPRQLGLVRTDVTGKLVAELSAGHGLVLKLGFYDERSHATYLGLTTPQFEDDPDANAATGDVFDIRRYGLGLTHVLQLGSQAVLETRLYGHDLARNWRRQDFDREDLGEDYVRVVTGQNDTLTPEAARADGTLGDGSSIWFRATTGHRDRHFLVAGLEPRVVVDATTGPVVHTLQAGARLHREDVDDRYLEGSFPQARSGALLDHQVRHGTALAGYVLDRLSLVRGLLQISPGLRVESLWTRLHELRADGLDVVPVPQVDRAVTGVLPGLGLALVPGERLTAFAGVHRGWAPPRTKDALLDTGESLTLEAETSWNSEVGVRLADGERLYAEGALFRLDFGNQVIDPAESQGAVTTGGTVQGGRTVHQGAELGVRLDPLAETSLSLPMSFNYTFVHAEFREGWGAALLGQRLPYAPAHDLQVGVGLERDVADSWGLGAHATGTYTSSQYADAIQTVEPSLDGLVGLIPARFLLDATLQVSEPRTGLGLVLAGKNLTDEIYITSRSPRGIQPGLRRHLFVGVQGDW
jgi:Fe(3+) dicitrate transport protein